MNNRVSENNHEGRTAVYVKLRRWWMYMKMYNARAIILRGKVFMHVFAWMNERKLRQLAWTRIRLPSIPKSTRKKILFVKEFHVSWLQAETY